ncbi:MAG: hypothetical protein M0Q21_12340 [Ignavibacteriaceae bacterium]|nr:hypothetical protein [Ignavibacteriaceae bacterium]
MLPNLTIRKATISDIDFIIETIIESDKSGTNVISACNIFNLNINNYRGSLSSILTENFENNEYHLSGFLIAESEGEYIGALNSWIEEKDGISNAIIKSTLLMSVLEKEKLVKQLDELSLINSLSIERKSGSIQLEYGYVREQFRRKGVFTILIIENIKKYLPELKSLPNIQSILFKANFKSLNAFINLGFKPIITRRSDNLNIFKYYPFNEKILVELDTLQASRLIK